MKVGAGRIFSPTCKQTRHDPKTPVASESSSFSAFRSNVNLSTLDLATLPVIGEQSRPRRGKAPALALSRLDTPIGTLLAGASQDGLCLLEYTDTGRVSMQLANLQKRYRCEIDAADSRWFEPLAKQLTEWFGGTRRSFDLPLDLRGSEFQLKVWAGLQRIPCGETRSYGQLAAAIGCPRAWRALGSANRLNPISIVIPCHRVIASNGRLAGYGGGEWRKQALIDHEGNSGKPFA